MLQDMHNQAWEAGHRAGFRRATLIWLPPLILTAIWGLLVAAMFIFPLDPPLPPRM